MFGRKKKSEPQPEPVVESSYSDSSDYDYDDVIEDPVAPDCASWCGGDWPNCKYTCPMYDD